MFRCSMMPAVAAGQATAPVIWELAGPGPVFAWLSRRWRSLARWPGLLPAADRPVRIVALGDSLTAGLGLPANAAFPARLEQALKAKGLAVEVANAGVSGDTAPAGSPASTGRCRRAPTR